jgi:ribosome-interacting GTPase 1
MSNEGLLSDVSLIVPVAPGEDAWRTLLGDLGPFAGELLVVGTVPEPFDFAERVGDRLARWVISECGRALQQNAGARSATRPFLWFVHADTRIPPDAFSALATALARQSQAVHFFDLQFLPDGPTLMFLNAWGTRFRSRGLGLPFGDQGLCLPKDLFDVLGGFDTEAAYGEDHLLIWAAHRRRVPVRCTGASIQTSARKYRERGWLRTTCRHVVLTVRQAFGEWRSGERPSVIAGLRLTKLEASLHRTRHHMAVNAPPQYFKAEEAYRRAGTAQEQVACLEEMLVLLPKHKASEKVQADLKTRLKEAKEQLQAERSAPKKGKTYRFPRQGAGQAIILGGPNAGKSRVLKELTNAHPEVAPFPFTTREPMPGMMPWEDVAVQLIDTPPITDSLFEAYIPNLVRATDLVLLAFDGSSDDAPEHTAEVLRQLDQRKTHLARETGFVEDDFSRVRVKTLLVVTRADDSGAKDRLEFFHEMVPGENGQPRFEELLIELDRPESVTELRNRIFQALGVIRVYTKAPGKPADYSSPFTIPTGGTIEDLAGRVHNDLVDKVKSAKLWSYGQKDMQTIGRDAVLHDRDLVELQT